MPDRGRGNLRPAPPFAEGNEAAVTHGAYSARIAPAARAQKRRFLARNGLRTSDLDGIGLALLDNWARAQAKVELLDAHFAEVGLLDGRGKPRAATAFYVSLLNSARLAVVRLSEHLRASGRLGDDPLAALLKGP